MSVRTFLESLYPGDDARLSGLRAELERVATRPGLITVLLEGPPGAGKTVMARALAIARRLVAVSPHHSPLSVESACEQAFSQKPLTWYREISLAGLVESLADGQLFGVGKEVATGVSPRVGIFEQAMTGFDPTDAIAPHDDLVKQAKEKRRLIPLITGGVVLLDEIGDLPGSLQAKLLRVLNGEKQWRVGVEGHPRFAFEFAGLVVLATWKNLEKKETQLRPDLWQRICQNRVRVPSLSAYSAKSRERIVNNIVVSFQRHAANELQRIQQITQELEDGVCTPSWLQELGRRTRHSLTAEQIRHLVGVDWAQLGEFRGLWAVVMRVFEGEKAKQAVQSLHVDMQRQAGGDGALSSQRQQDIALLERFLTTPSLAEGWQQFKVDWAKRMNRCLAERDAEVEKLISEAGKGRADIKKGLENLSRSRGSGGSIPDE